MKLPSTAHTSRPWRIHDIAPDFQFEDVWALRTPGGPDDLPRLVSTLVSDDSGTFPDSAPMPVRLLWAARWKIGAVFGWDGPNTGLGSRVNSLRDRLPEDLRQAPRGPDFKDVPFTSLYLLHNEWAAEMANRTVHTVSLFQPDPAGQGWCEWPG
ncbi:DUF2867 domain-containing protein, partial [Micromonospora andamanensis]|uniref:DUF2867 domain-containing protein n=2 Tax=Micromonospora andamanensis TaxID=1287068 RepID=UPI0035EACBE2